MPGEQARQAESSSKADEQARKAMRKPWPRTIRNVSALRADAMRMPISWCAEQPGSHDAGNADGGEQHGERGEYSNQDQAELRCASDSPSTAPWCEFARRLFRINDAHVRLDPAATQRIAICVRTTSNSRARGIADKPNKSWSHGSCGHLV